MDTKKYLDYEGVKYLWSKISGCVDKVISHENINLTIADPMGRGITTTVTVTINDSSKETYQYNSSTITIKVPSEKSYTITFADVEGYITPSPINRISVAGNSISMTVIYEELPITVGIVGLDGKVYRTTAANVPTGADALGVVVNTDQFSVVVAPTLWISYWASHVVPGNTDIDPQGYIDEFESNSRSSFLFPPGGTIDVDGLPSQQRESDMLEGNYMDGQAYTNLIYNRYKNEEYTDSAWSYSGVPAAEYAMRYNRGGKSWYIGGTAE